MRAAVRFALLTVSCILVASAQSPAQQQAQSPERVRTRFLRTVFNRLDEANANLVGDASHQIIQFVDKGVKTLESGGMKPPDIARADDNIRLFGDQLVIKGRGDTNTVRVDEQGRATGT